MGASTTNNKTRYRLLAAGSIIALMAIWEIAALWVGRELILPTPFSALRSLIGLAARGDFWVHVSATVLRGLVGFGLSYLAGFVLGLAAGLSPGFAAAFRPLLVGIRSTPVMAFILLALIWFRTDLVAIFVTFLVVFPPVADNVAEGIRSVDPHLIEMARVYRVKPGRILRQMYVPAILPYLAAAAAAGLGLTWKVMISAEVLSVPRWGIGSRMDSARTFLDTPEVFAWTAVVVILGLIFDWALQALVRKHMAPWRVSPGGGG